MNVSMCGRVSGWRGAGLAAVAMAVAVGACTADPSIDRLPQEPVQVHDAWSRPADSGAVGVAYFVLTNRDTVLLTLTGVTTPVARVAEVHESMQHNGMAHMQARPTVDVAAGDSAVFRAGGLHVMLIDLSRALRAGDTVPLTLHFAHGDSLPMSVVVQSPTGAP